MNRTEYNKIDAVNYSSLKWIASHSLKHYRRHCRLPTLPTKSMVLGSATHCAILEPQKFALNYVGKPDGMSFSTKEGKEWRAAHSDVQILENKQWIRMLEMGAAVLEHDDASTLIEATGSCEHVIVWIDPVTALRCKGTVDKWIASDRILIEVKTAADVRADKFQRSAADLLYHMQLAFYFDGVSVAEIVPEEHLVIVVESEPPHDVVVEVVQQDVRQEGREIYLESLAKLAEARATGQYPGVAQDRRVYGIPAYARRIEG